MRRRQEVLNKVEREKQSLLQNVGGSLLNPPESCAYRKQYPDKGIWADLSCCTSVCHNKCSHFKWFLKATIKDRVQYLLDNGVYYPWKYSIDDVEKTEEVKPEVEDGETEWKETIRPKYKRETP